MIIEMCSGLEVLRKNLRVVFVFIRTLDRFPPPIAVYPCEGLFLPAEGKRVYC